MNKNTFLDVIIILFLLGASIVVVNIYLQSKKDSGQCMLNPFVYGSHKLAEQEEVPVYGTIFIEGKGTLNFNSTTMIGGTKWQELSSG